MVLRIYINLIYFCHTSNLERLLSMTSRTLCIVLALLILLNLSFAASKPKEDFRVGVRFKSLECESDNVTIVIKYCFLKAVSRRVVFLNVGMTHKKPLTKPYFVRFIFFYKYGTIYRQIMDTHENEVCSIMDGHPTNPLIDLTFEKLNMTKEAAPIFRKCPHDKDLDLHNISVPTRIKNKGTIFPDGVYRIDLYLYKRNMTILKLKIEYENKSGLQESFG